MSDALQVSCLFPACHAVHLLLHRLPWADVRPLFVSLFTLKALDIYHGSVPAHRRA